MQPPVRMVGYVGERVSEPSLWIDIVQTAGGDEGVHSSCPWPTTIGTTEHPTFSPAGNLSES